MRFILLGLVFYLLVAAYFAAVRVARKRQLAKSSGQTLPPSSLQTRLDQTSLPQSAKEAIGSALDAVGLTDQPQTAETPASETIAQQPVSQPPVSQPPAATPASSVESAESAAIAPTAAPQASGAIDATLDQISAAIQQETAASDLTAIAEPAQEISEPAPSETAAPELPGVEASAPLSAPEIPAPEIPAPISAQETASETAASPMLPIGSPMVLDPDTDLTLAVSLSVTDIVHPESAGAIEVPDLIPTDPAISEVLHTGTEPAPAHHPSILEEIAELRPMADAQANPTSRILHVLQTGDGTMRVAAVYELGELAVQRHGSEAQELIQQLQQLTQDEDPDVRLQAIAALAKVQG